MSSTSFVNSLFNTDKINKGDRVQIIGKDPLKGFYGYIKRIKEITVEEPGEESEFVYTIELEATGGKTDRSLENIKKVYFS